MKSCVLYIAHKYDKSSIKNFEHLQSQLDKDKYDLIWCAPKKFSSEPNIKWFIYNNRKVKRRGFVNPSVAVEDFYLKYSKYKYYYVIEWDVYYSGNLNSLLQEFDKNLSADLLASYIGNYDIKSHWHWYQTSSVYFLLKPVLKCKLQDCANGCMSFSRLSNKALETICGYTKLRQLFIYELYWTTICKLNGLKISCLNKQESSEEYFTNYDLMNKKIFHWSTKFTSKDKLEKNLFYTKYIWV